MNKLLVGWFCIVLVSTGCVKSQNNQDLILAMHKCKKAELRAVGLRDSEGKLYIQCRLSKKEKS